MDQPFSGLAKELFEVQHYPQAILDGSAKPVTLPYDVTGWTLPMQMGVQGRCGHRSRRRRPALRPRARLED